MVLTQIVSISKQLNFIASQAKLFYLFTANSFLLGIKGTKYLIFNRRYNICKCVRPPWDRLWCRGGVVFLCSAGVVWYSYVVQGGVVFLCSAGVVWYSYVEH